MRRRAKARRIIAILLLAAIISIAAAYAASYPVNWSRPLDLYALWSASTSLMARHSKTLDFTASWLAQANPSTALSRQLALTVLWDAGYAITSPKPFTLRLIDLAEWRILVEKTIPDYLGRWRLFSISASPLLRFDKEFFDGSVSIYTAGVVEMFYNSSREPVVYGGVFERIEGGYLIRGGPGTIRIHDKARCTVYTADNKGIPYGAATVLMNGSAVPFNEWFDCPNGAYYNITVEGLKVARIYVNGAEKAVESNMVKLANSTAYTIAVVVKTPALIRIDEVKVTRLPHSRIQLDVSGVAIDVRHGIGIENARIYFRVNNIASGSTKTKAGGVFNATIIPPAYFPPNVDAQVTVRAILGHVDYEALEAVRTVTVPGARPAIAIPIETVGIAAVAGLIVIGLVAGLAKARKTAKQMIAWRRKALREG